MEFLFEYGLFLLKAVTVVIAVGAIVILIAAASRKDHGDQGLTIEKLNDKYQRMRDVLRENILSKHEWKQIAKEEKKAQKQADKNAPEGEEARKRVFVVRFHGDIRASATDSLREEISSIVAVARKTDEVVVCIENPGGVVHDHGLAASQLQRVRDREIPMVAVVDKVAASGGYLMACVANKIVAAPFAIIGSVGVVAQVPNFNRALETHGVDFEQVTAGKHKRTVTMFGKNTDEDRAKLKEELEDVHTLFKDMVSIYRPALDVEKIATGEHWYGTRAMDLGLIDELGSSDDYLMAAAEVADVYEVTYKGKQGVVNRIQQAMSQAGTAFADWVSTRQSESRFYR